LDKKLGGTYWKSRNKDLNRTLEDQKEELIRQIEAANKAVKAETQRAEKERERADLLQAEIEQIKKKSRS